MRARSALIQFTQGEGADSHGFGRAKARHADADALQRIVPYFFLAARHSDLASLALEELFQSHNY